MTNEPPPYPGESDPSTHDLPSYGSTPPPQGGYPPPPSGGFQPPIGGGSPYSATDAIGYGWRKFRDNVGSMIVATLIVGVGTIVLGYVAEAIAPSTTIITGDGFDFEAGEVVASVLAQTITGAISFILYAMLVKGSFDVVDGRRFDIAKAFAALDFGKVVIAGLLVGLLGTIGTYLLVLPGLVFTIFAYFTLHFVVDKGREPLDAVGSSFKLVAANFGNGLLTGLLAALVLLAGLLLCLVGLLAAVPIITLAGAYAFRRFQGEPVAP